MQDACWERGSREKMGETEAVSLNQPPWALSSLLHQPRGRHRNPDPQDPRAPSPIISNCFLSLYANCQGLHQSKGWGEYSGFFFF